MAIKLIANYSKRLGLPGYSSHQFSVSVETEVMNTGDLTGEAERLYQLLQANVDEQIQTTGFVPPGDYGMDPLAATPPQARPKNVGGSAAPREDRWKCSDKQRDLILKLIAENQRDEPGIESLAVERFGKGLRMLNKIEASGLIDELLDTYGGGSSRQGHGQGRGKGSPYSGANGRRAA